MRNLVKYLLSAAFLSIFLPLNAQKLPTFSAAKEITRGTLANSVSYYIAKNASYKGYADFALVQKGCTDPQKVRESLAYVPHFGNVKPYDFLARHGVGYSPRGYVYTVPAATVVRFQNVPVYDSSVSDSTLLLLVDIMDTYEADQAVMVCGDVDVQRIEERLKMLSMIVSTRQTLGAEGEYKWTSCDSLTIDVRNNYTENCATISARYSSPRTDKALMNTPQPIVKQIFSDELACILRSRVTSAFKAAGIPLADVRYRYSGTNISSDDEVYEVSISVGRSDLYRSSELFGAIISDVSREGCFKDEFLEAKARVYARTRKENVMMASSNRSYLDRCEAAFCYGASLASPSETFSFFSKHQLQPDRELELFNKFASALLTREKNLKLQILCPQASADAALIRANFLKGWDDATSVTPIKELKDTSAINLPSRTKKVKIASTSTEPLTGGSLWTFSNGMMVIYKKVANDAGTFDFSFLLKGGPNSIPEMIPQEQAYVEEMFSICNVAGMSSDDFYSMLSVNGIQMQPQVTLSDMRFSGTAKKSSFQLLIKALVALSKGIEVPTEEYDYFRAGEKIRLDMARQTQRGINSLMDSIISPDYHRFCYNSYEGLTQNLPEYAAWYFRNEFSKANDGVFVLVGDLDEEYVKQTLCKCLGALDTEKRYSARPQIRYSIGKSWSTTFTDSKLAMIGERSVGVNMALAAPKTYSPANTMAFKIALLALETEISKALAEEGMYASVTGNAEMFPIERMTVYINARPANPSGLPEGVSPASPVHALAAVRRAVTIAASRPISASALAAYKSALTAREESRNATREALVDAVLIRYSLGRDVVSLYKDAIKGVTQKSVQNILRELDNTCKVEYVIQ